MPAKKREKKPVETEPQLVDNYEPPTARTYCGRPALFHEEKSERVHGTGDCEFRNARALLRGETVIAHFYEVDCEPTKYRDYAHQAALALNTFQDYPLPPVNLPLPGTPPPMWVERHAYSEKYPDIFLFYIMGPYVCDDPNYSEHGRPCVYGETDNDVFTAWRFAASGEMQTALQKLLARHLTLCPQEAGCVEVQEAQAALAKAATGFDATRPHIPLLGVETKTD